MDELGIPRVTNNRRIRCIETGEEFDAIYMGACKYFISKSSLYRMLSGDIKWAGKDKYGNKLHWEYIK